MRPVDEIYGDLLKRGFQDSTCISWLSKWADFIGYIVTPAGFVGLSLLKPANDNGAFWWSIFGGLFVIQAVFYVFRWLKPEISNDIVLYGHQLYEKNKELQNELEELHVKSEYLVEYQNISIYYNAMTHPLVVEKIGKTSESIHALVADLLGVIVKLRVELFGFTNDIWTLKVYRYDNVKHRLVCYCGSRDDRHTKGAEVTQGEGRAWKSGQGHIGRAHMDKEPKITENADVDEIWSMMGNTPQDEPNDRQIYRSFASIPILKPKANSPLEENGEMEEEALGVVIATSNHAKRFTLWNSMVLSLLADRIGVLWTEEQQEGARA